MKFNSVLIVVATLVAVGASGLVIESQEQQHDLGLENAIPEEENNESTLDGLPGIPVAGNAVFRVVGQEDGYLVVEILIKRDERWYRAKIQNPDSGIQLLSGK